LSSRSRAQRGEGSAVDFVSWVWVPHPDTFAGGRGSCSATGSRGSFRVGRIYCLPFRVEAQPTAGEQIENTLSGYYYFSVTEETGLNSQINVAFLGVQRRAESVDRQTLVRTFVDIGSLFAILSSQDHQIVYGRRGTGKTHALLYVAEKAKQGNAIPVYVDLRSIGSSGGMYADASIPIPQRATRLLLDVLGSIHEVLLQHAVSSGMNLASVGPALDELAAAATDVEVVGETHHETRDIEGVQRQTSSASTITLQPKPGAEYSKTTSSAASSGHETRTLETGTSRYRVHFGSSGKALANLVKAARPSQLLFVLDEWSYGKNRRNRTALEL
jgi:hypothetical protein